MSTKILIVDDEENIRRVLAATLERENYIVTTCMNGYEALAKLREEKYNIVISDLKMPIINGVELLKEVTTHYPEIPFIIITAFGTVDNAVETIKAGAFDYITKPFDQTSLLQIIEKAKNTAKYNLKHYFEKSGKSPYRMIGESARIEKIYHVIDQVADTPSTVLITGESGTGKELIAQALHEKSSRKNNPFIKINCAAIPENLLESELFGYEKGAFTGADIAKPGKFELANTGTLFLDEIAEMPIEMQVKLLRVLQEKEIERVGGLRPIKVDLRLITATNKNLEEEIENGKFRDDLYYRLNVVPIDVPPLRDRKEDIPLLVFHFIEKFNKLLNKNVQTVHPDVMTALSGYNWPGNIRQLENLIERMMLFTNTTELQMSAIPDELSCGRESRSENWPSKKDLKSLVKETTHKLEKDIIIKTLKEHEGNVTQSAKTLGISRKGLQNKMKELGLREDERPFY